MTATNLGPRKTCPVQGCTRAIGNGKLMCGPHWGAVPPALQKRVYRTYRIWLRAMGDTDRMREYQAAAREALEAV